MTNDLVVETLITNKTGPTLVRVLLQYDILKWKYPLSGVWSYLLKDTEGIIVFDTGPFYNTLLGNKGKKTNNTQKIFDAIDITYGLIPIKQIMLSHYHHDHSQNAADLQLENYRKYGTMPPIRIHKDDRGEKKLLKVLKSGLGVIHKKLGHNNVLYGKEVNHNENVGDTGFSIVHSPGHTHGSISLINHQEKVIITGWWVGKSPNLITSTAMRLINEDFKNILSTEQKLKFKDYSYFYLHKLDK